jgi:hypothetical protein
MIGAVKRLGKTQLDINPLPIVTVAAYPLNGQTVLTAIWIANTDTLETTVTLRYGTGVLDVSDALLENVRIPAQTTLLLTESEGLLVLGAGEQLQGFAGTLNKVVVSVSGVEII